MLGNCKRCKSSLQSSSDFLSRIIRTVSLDKKSDDLAAKKPNFSRWVRDQLQLQDEEFQNSHVTLSIFRDKGICNPTASPRCNICFPYGRPEMIDIRAYNANIISKEDLQERTKKKFKKDDTKSSFGISNIQKDGIRSEIKEVKKERKYLRRSLRYIWSFI